MSTPKTPVRFMPSLPKAQTPASSPTPQQKPQPKPSVVQDDLLIERPTILRVKRRRDELLNDSIVLEASQPAKKRKVMQELTEALHSMNVAAELHMQFQEHLKQQQQQQPGASAAPSTSGPQEKPGLPPPVWSAPSKTVERQMRKLFRLIGSDDGSRTGSQTISTLVNELQSGKAQKKDLLKTASARSYDQERKARGMESKGRAEALRAFHLRRVPIPQNAQDDSVDDEPCKMLELVVAEEDMGQERTTMVENRYVRQIPSGVKLPVVKSSRKIKEQAELKAQGMDYDPEYVTAYYVLDDETQLESLQDFQSVVVPMSQFRQELLDDYVLEGEYSDSDRDSDDSQNRSDEWEYGSDPDDDEDRVAGSGSDEEASDQGPQDYAEDEFDDVDYHDQSYRHHKGFDLVIDPTERLNSDEEPDD